MQYEITISGNKYLIQVENGALIVNDVRHKIKDTFEDLCAISKESYMAECVKKYKGVDTLNWRNYAQLKVMYEEALPHIDEEFKQRVIRDAYVDDMLETFFPNITDYISANISFSVLLSMILIKLLDNVLPKEPYNVGIVLTRDKYFSVGFEGTDIKMKLPTTGTEVSSFSPNLILY